MDRRKRIEIHVKEEDILNILPYPEDKTVGVCTKQADLVIMGKEVLLKMLQCLEDNE